VRALPAHVGKHVGVQGLAAELDEGVSLPFGMGAAVAGGAMTVHDRFECGVHGLGADRVEVAGEVRAST
jgi:hypothetical protein